MLIIFSGLPGTGKSSLAKELAKKIKAVYVRIDTIEQAILNSRQNIKDIADTGYSVAYKIAEDNLKCGLDVIADSVNPIPITRHEWQQVAQRAGVSFTNIEISCSNPIEHKSRIETRTADIEGHKLPDWQSVMKREYESWNGKCFKVDTSGRSVGQCVDEILHLLSPMNLKDQSNN